MSVLKLRTLTRKSKFGFGKYSEHTVQSVLDRKNSPYIHWVYYNASNITFTDDILAEVGIYADKLIIKPGKNPDLYNSDCARAINSLKFFKLKSHDKKQTRITKQNQQIVREKRWFNKSANAWKNQGH